VEQVKQLAMTAKSLSLEILLELHDEGELDHINEYTDIVGINNRNLKTFDVDMEKSIKMADRIGTSKLKIAESGISEPMDMVRFRTYGFDGCLIGERFMKEPDPGKAFRSFVSALKSLA